MMPEGRPANDEERLPWLEPYRDPGGRKGAGPAAAAPARQRKRGAGLLVGGVAAIAAALTAGYWIGQRGTVAQAPAPVVASKPAPAPPPVPQRSEAAENASPPATEAEPAPRPHVVAHRAAPRTIARHTREIRSAGLETRHLRQVEAAQHRAAAAPARQAAASQPAAPRTWPRMPSPGPAGQVIQLGAFRTPAGAYAAYRMRLARYPTLAALPRAILPVITKPRGQILYVLRLGTTSRQQSAIVCRNLRASGDHCLVIG